jgi:excisionase family DNA binding protein
VINPYELLDTLFPGSFPREARFKLAESPARDTRLNLQEASEFLGVTTRRLKDLCREKRITHTRIDYRTYRFTRADLDAWLVEYRMNRKAIFGG